MKFLFYQKISTVTNLNTNTVTTIQTCASSTCSNSTITSGVLTTNNYCCTGDYCNVKTSSPSSSSAISCYLGINGTDAINLPITTTCSTGKCMVGKRRNFILFYSFRNLLLLIKTKKQTTTNYASSNTISRSYYSCAPTTCPTNTNLVGYTCCSTANCNTGDAPLSGSQSSHFISHFGIQFMLTSMVAVACAIFKLV